MSWETKLFSRVSHIYAFQHFSNFLLFRLIIFCVVEKQSYSTVSAIFMPLNTFPLSSLLRFIISCVVGNKAILQCRPYLCLSALFHFSSFQAYNLLCCGKQSYSTVTPYLCLSALFHFSSFFAYDLLCCGKRSYSTYI